MASFLFQATLSSPTVSPFFTDSGARHCLLPYLSESTIVTGCKYRPALRENALQALADCHAAHLLRAADVSLALAIDEMALHERALIVGEI